MSTATTVHESKRGFHPCDHETFLKLKEAHKLLLRAYRDVKCFIRWDDKLPHNRKGSKPRCPADFIEIGFHQLDKHSFTGRGFARCRDSLGRTRNLYLHVLHEYQKARRPKARPEDVEPLDLPADLDEAIEKLREFYAE